MTQFLLFGAFFELLIFHHGTFMRYLWPLALILAGIAVSALSQRRHDDGAPAEPLPDQDEAPDDPNRVFPY